MNKNERAAITLISGSMISALLAIMIALDVQAGLVLTIAAMCVVGMIAL